MTSAQVVQQPNGENAISNILWDRGTLLQLKIRCPTFEKKMSSSDILRDGLSTDAFKLGTKKLIPKTALERVKRVEIEARTALKLRSVEFPISNAKFVYYRTLSEVLRILTNFKTQWDDSVAELIDAYPELRRNQIEVLNAEAQRLHTEALSGLTGVTLIDRKAELDEWLNKQKSDNRDLFPDQEKLLGMFGFSWSMYKISGVNGLSTMAGLEQDALLAAQEQLRLEMRQWVTDTSTAMHRALGEAALNAKNMLDKNGKLTARNMRPLFEAFESFQAVDFTGSSSFQTMINTVRERFLVKDAEGNISPTLSADAVNASVSTQQSFAEMLASMGNLAVDSVAEKAGLTALVNSGEFGRALEL